ncbi:MAG: hypothetical protein JXX28_17650, partial [Deltaproteobacteria bacterium]|nr:hypothetical protein [Deltaproteobacteria bacterium]
MRPHSILLLLPLLLPASGSAQETASPAKTPPQIGAVRLTPAAPSTRAALRCEVTGTAPTLRYAWTADGAPVPHTDPTLPADRTRKGVAYACAVTPSDGDLSGDTVRSEPVRVLNSPPALASA